MTWKAAPTDGLPPDYGTSWALQLAAIGSARRIPGITGPTRPARTTRVQPTAGT